MSDEIRKKNNSTTGKAIGIMATITVIGLIYILVYTVILPTGSSKGKSIQDIHHPNNSIMINQCCY